MSIKSPIRLTAAIGLLAIASAFWPGGAVAAIPVVS